MSIPAPSNAETLRARERLIDIVGRCRQDRYAHFPRHARDALGGKGGLGLVVFGTRGMGFPQQLDLIEAVVARNPGLRIAAIVSDDDAPVPARVRSYPTLAERDFFSRDGEFAGCLVVDRTCTWHPGVRNKVRLRKEGFAFLRVEQFLNAPGLDAGGGYFRGHSDHMLERFDEFLAFESVWSDDHSLQTYYYALAAFISMNHEFFAIHCGDYRDRYFPSDLGLEFSPSCIYVDCGAYDGHEALYFARLTGGKFGAIHAFEPDRRNYLTLCRNVNAHIASNGAADIFCRQFGVYDTNAFLGYAGYAAGVSVTGATAAGQAGIHVCRLDDTLDEMSYLRLEIEGAELAALRGAAGLIARCRPGMTLSVYHTPRDFPDIIGFVQNTGLGYRMRLRHQSLEPGVLCLYCD